MKQFHTKADYNQNKALQVIEMKHKKHRLVSCFEQ